LTLWQVKPLELVEEAGAEVVEAGAEVVDEVAADVGADEVEVEAAVLGVEVALLVEAGELVGAFEVEAWPTLFGTS